MTPAQLEIFFDNLAEQVREEVLHGFAMYGPLNSHHEGYGVLLEEVNEYWDEVRKRIPDRQAMREELIQIAAVAIRTALELT